MLRTGVLTERMSEPPPADTSGLAGDLRALVPQVVGAVLRRAGDFAAAEDAVQEALLAAATQWRERGAPENPGGWLYRVACRRLADQRDAERARSRRETAAAIEREAASDPAMERRDDAIGDTFLGDEDDSLLLLFLCCHPALGTDAAVALTLRAVGGLTTAEIASAYLVSEATMAKRIGRAKAAILEAGGRFERPPAAERDRRVAAVMHVLYLMFNEGYLRREGDALLRVDLSAEAIRLARLLLRGAPDEPEVEGLLALMLFTDARRAARTGPDGAMIPLHEQDRARWDRAAIAEGAALVTRAFGRGRVGAYQLQAAIAALHDEAPSVAATDWAQILALYRVLERLADNPVVALNRAVATAMVEGREAGLAELALLEQDARLAEQRYRIDAARAHLYEFAGDLEAAARHYRAAAAGTANEVERRYLAGKAERLGSKGGESGACEDE